MKEESRRRIARQFLIENFGKLGIVSFTYNGQVIPLRIIPFELYKAYESMAEGTNEARAFKVIYAPYDSGAENKMIAVSDSKDELDEIVGQCFDKDRVKKGLVKYADYKKYKVAYD